MSFGLLGYVLSQNLGDEIQSIAARRFLPRVDEVIDRDHLSAYRDGPRRSLILNGWFQLGSAWPPPDTLDPLLVSFHVARERPDLLDPRHHEWYRRHAPIGCRSTATVARFEALGLRAWFSGCLTLTLPPYTGERGDETLVVDCPPGLLGRLVPARVRARATRLTHVALTDTRSLRRRAVTRALREMASRAPAVAWQLAARYRQHRHEERMAQARALLDRYARARLVITGRLHAFLPCLALGTPVVFLCDVSDPDRVEGLADLGRTYTPADERIDLDWDRPAPNPGRHEPIARALEAACLDWVRARDPRPVRARSPHAR